MKRALIISAAAALLASACTSEPAQTETQNAQPAAAQTPVTHVAEDASLQWGPCPEIFPAGCEITVVHGDPAQANADIFLRVPGGYQIPAHSHTSAERMILVSGQLNVRYQGAPEAELTAGEYAYGPAGLPHVANCVSSEPCTLFIAFEQPVDALPYEGAVE
jgi:quercetin dioxygenase-like cupin family protein